MTGRKYEPQEVEGGEPPQIPPTFGSDLFFEWRSPRFGPSNPTDFSNPVWEWLIRTRKDAYRANEEFEGPPANEKGPGWCFRRFGQSTTTLIDGRKIYIAGEHEDHYDPDFFIYNDVVVENPDGTFQIYGYPKELFPPTDFHTSTLVGNSIIIIGSLGYKAERGLRRTQVLRLNLNNFQMEQMNANGNSPGWIHEHIAELSHDGHKIVIKGGKIQRENENRFWENIDEWELNLSTWSWKRLTDKQWQRWSFVRKDRKPCYLWRLRSAISSKQYMKKSYFLAELQKITLELECEPDLEIIPKLYQFDSETRQIQGEEYETRVHKISVDETIIRFREGHNGIRVMVEGQLKLDRLKALQDSICAKLKKIDGADWEVVEP